MSAEADAAWLSEVHGLLVLLLHLETVVRPVGDKWAGRCPGAGVERKGRTMPPKCPECGRDVGRISFYREGSAWIKRATHKPLRSAARGERIAEALAALDDWRARNAK